MNEKELCLSLERFIHPGEKGLTLRDIFLEDVDGTRMSDDGGMEITIDDMCYILMRYNYIEGDTYVCGVFREKNEAESGMWKVITTVLNEYAGRKSYKMIESDVTNEYEGIHIWTHRITMSTDNAAAFHDLIWVDEKIFGKIEV